MKFNVNPHHAFLNSHIQLSNHTTETIDITCKQLDKTWRLSPNQVVDNICIKHYGKYDFSCMNSGESQCVVVKDAIRLGGSNFRKTFAFEKNSWFLVSMKDRTYFYNHITNEQYLENDIAPENVIGLNENYLFFTNEKNTTYGALYSTIERNIVRYIQELIAYNEQYIVCKSDDYVEIIGISPQIADAKVQVGKSKYAYYAEIHSIAYISANHECFVYNIVSNRKQSFSVTASDGEQFLLLQDIPYIAKISTNSISVFSVESDESPIHIWSAKHSRIVECNGISLRQESETDLAFYKRQHTINHNVISIAKIRIRCHNKDTIYLEKQYYEYASNPRWNSEYLTEERHTLENTENIILTELPKSKYVEFQDTKRYFVVSSNAHMILVNENTIYVQKNAHYFQVDGCGYYFVRQDKQINIYTDSNVLLCSSDIEKDEKNITCGLIGAENGWYDFTKQHFIKHKEYKSLFDTSQLVFFDNHDACYIYIYGFCRLLEVDVDNILYISQNGDIAYIRKNNQFYYACYNQTKLHYNLTPIVLVNFDSSHYSNALFTDTENVILCKEWNLYVLYNIQRDTKETFDNTNFVIKGLNGYQPIISFDRYKRPVLKDPVTLCPATPEVLSAEYAFISPSGRYKTLFSRKFKNKVLGSIVNEAEKANFLSQYDIQYINDKEIKERHIANRHRLYDEHRDYFDCYFTLYTTEEEREKCVCECMLNDIFAQYLFNEIISILDLLTQQEINIEIIGTLWFKNYVSFSYDDKYVAIAGRYPNDGNRSGYMGVYDIENRRMIRSEDLGYAVWLTAFTKDSKIAFYTSVPNTYIFNPNFSNDIQEIKGKNFLCYSADGKYMALSEQGYRCYDDKLPYNDWGHTKSTTVYIYNVESLKLIETIHCMFGTQIEGVAQKSNNIAYVAFSQNNNSILISSNDGVVLKYNLHL